MGNREGAEDSRKDMHEWDQAGCPQIEAAIDIDYGQDEVEYLDEDNEYLQILSDPQDLHKFEYPGLKELSGRGSSDNHRPLPLKTNEILDDGKLEHTDEVHLQIQRLTNI